eukprot:447205_1
MAELEALEAVIAPTTEEEKQEAEQAEEDAAWYTKCFVWCCNSASITDKIQFSLWVICGVLSPVFYFTYLNQEGTELNYGYFLICGLSLVLAGIATGNFNDIREFRELVEALRENVNKLIEERKKIRGEVTNLQDTRFKLQQLEIEHSVTNARLRAQLQQYEEWYPTTLSTANAQYKQIKKIHAIEEAKILKQRRTILRAEQQMLYVAMEQFEKRDDGKVGLTKKEFEPFIKALPQRYGIRMERANVTFEDFCGMDLVMNREEFKDFLNEMVLTEVEDLAQGFGINIPGMKDTVDAPPPPEEVKQDQ